MSKTAKNSAPAAEQEAENVQPAGELAVQGNTALATMAEPDFAADAGAGMESADSDSYAIPFLVLLQKGSPQVDEASGAAIEGARAGMFYNNVTGELLSGKDGIIIVPVYFRREFLRWAPRALGGGFRGAMTPEEVAEQRARGKILELERQLYVPAEDGTLHKDKSDHIADTREHYVLYKGADGEWHNAMLSLASTQIKKSKQLMGMLADVRFTGPNGQKYQPASFASQVKLTTVPESNEKGTWFGARFEMAGRVDSPTYAHARAFYEAVKGGKVEANYNNLQDDEAAQAASSGSGDSDRF